LLVSGSINAARVTYQILRSNIKFTTKLGFNGEGFFFFFFLGPVCISSGSTAAFKAYCACGEGLKITVFRLSFIIHQTKNVEQPRTFIFPYIATFPGIKGPS
jgi:hypothetical protein